MSFQILEHIDKLTPSEEKGRYICPACQGNNFTIGKNGAYQCWSGCKNEDIREALAPRGERHQSRSSNRVRPRKSKPNPPAPAPLPAQDKMVLARLPELPTDIPVKQHRLDRERGKIAEIIYRYDADREVNRSEWADSEKPKGYAKSVIPCHVDSSGQVLRGKGSQPWPLYREAEALLYGLGKWVVLPEGEPCVEVCRWLQLLGVTFQGSDWSQEVIEKKLVELKTAGIAGILCLPDNDEPGTKKANKIALAADIVGMPLVIIPPLALWSDMPHAGDIADWVKWGQEQGMDKDDFIRRLEEQFHACAASRAEAENLEDVDIPDFANRARDVKEIFCQTAFDAIYSYWPWICLKNVLYCWSKCQTHYFESPDVVERRRIAEFCNTYPVEHTTKSGEVYYKYDYATPEWVERVLKWVKIRLAIKPELANPPGLNCTNGVLQLEWSDDKPSWTLVDHDPKMYYTYEPLVEYNPDAPSTNCERLLEVLDKPQQEVFLRTIAASLDMATVRKYKGRLVRALLLKGSGNNGKDTLREAVAAMYGYRGMTGSTLTDFAAYDQGRKFPLSRLSNSRVNWASENANFAFLDKIQSLKAFVTGDPLDIEHKGKDHYEFIPVGVGLFNVNDTPNLQGSLEAILSRYGVLTFIKTFKIGADPSKGEIEADSRFKYDPDFLRSEVLPAFLNRVLAALTQLMAEGIDYRCTEKAFADIQAENSHLFQFCQATRLGYNPNGKVYAGEIWSQLEQWYVGQGALTYESSANGKKKAIWSPFSDKRSDELVKSANQVVKRFSSLFPKAKRGNDKHKVYLTGLSFNTAPTKNSDILTAPLNQSTLGRRDINVDEGAVKMSGFIVTPTPGGEPIEPLGEPMGSQLVSLQPLPNKDGEPSEPIDPYPGNEENFLGNIKSETFESNLKCWSESVGENLAHLPHHPALASDTGSPIDSLIGSASAQIGSPSAQIGSPPFHHEELAQPGQSPVAGDSDNQRLSESAPALNPASPKEADALAPSAASTPNPQNLVIHDFVIDASGRMAYIAKFARGGWLTSENQHISRDDLKAGVYTKLDPSRADLPPSLLDAMILIGEANGINDLEMLRDLTQDWSGEYKKEVWGYLSPKLQAKYLALWDAVT